MSLENFKIFIIFLSSELFVYDSLRNVKSRFEASSKKWFKCSFVIENVQLALYSGVQPLLNTRHWTTSTYDGVYFNDFIFFGLKQEILNRVIINSVTGSSWHFKRFVSLAVKILDDAVETSM